MQLKLEEGLSINQLCLFARDSYGALWDRTPAVFFISCTDVLRQFHMFLLENCLYSSFCSFIEADEFVSSFELNLLYIIETV